MNVQILCVLCTIFSKNCCPACVFRYNLRLNTRVVCCLEAIDARRSLWGGHQQQDGASADVFSDMAQHFCCDLNQQPQRLKVQSLFVSEKTENSSIFN